MTLDGDRSPILLLGGPGTGKSSLLRWLSEQLPESEWHVLAIKSDAIPHTVMAEAELCEWLGFGRKNLRCVLEGHARERRVCVIFDQLDALASTVDTQTSRLVVLLRLLREACTLDNVQVVASTRHFELLYDPRLRTLREQDEARTLELGELPADTIASSWKMIKGEPLDPQFIRARTPWVFRLMLALDDPESNDSELLAAFWRRQVEAPVEPGLRAELRELTQSLEANESLWSTPQPTVSLDFWVDRGVLARMDSRYGFVHQSLLDYARAERIIHEDVLTKVVLSLQDGLAVRPLLRATLRVLRGLEPRQYNRAVAELWQSPHLRAHVRVLLVEHIGEQADPSQREVEWMRAAIRYQGASVRRAARSSVFRSQMWFDKLRTTLRQLMSTELGGELLGVLSNAWSFEPATIDSWLVEAWASGTKQVEWATDVMIRRKSWDQHGIELAIKFVDAGMSGEQVGLLAHVLSNNSPAYEARLLGRYALREWRTWSRCTATEDLQLRRSSPWEFASALEWKRAAKRNPTQYLETISARLVSLAPESSRDEPGRFREDRYSLYQFTPQRQVGGEELGGEKLGRDEGVLFAIGTALATLAETERTSFWDWINRLSSIDHDVIQALILSAMEHAVEHDTARVVAFLNADARRWLFEQPLAVVLPKLAPQLDEDQAEQLWVGIQSTNLHNLDFYRDVLRLDPQYRRVLRKENEAYRVSLLQALAQAPLPSEARAALAQWSRRNEPMEPRTPSVWTINSVSPYDHEQFAQMHDVDLLAALEKYPDGRCERVDYATHKTTEMMCAELQIFARRHGRRALSLLSRLPSEGQFQAASALLDGASEDVDVDPDDLVHALANPWGRGFHVDLHFRGTCARLLGRQAGLFSNESRAIALQILDESLSLDWGPSSSNSADNQPDNQPLFPRPSLFYGTPNVFSTLIAAANLRLASKETTRGTAFLDLLEAQIERLPDACWCLFLAHNWLPGAQLGRWITWITKLFERHPGVLSSPEGAREVERISPFVDELRMHGWLDALRSSTWPSGARVADELTTMLACRGEHRNWARAELEGWLVGAVGDHELGVVNGLATLRNKRNSTADIDWALVPFVQRASPDSIALLFDRLRGYGLRMTNEMLDVLLTLENRELPIAPTVRASLVAGLSESLFLDTRPDAVARAARYIAAGEPIGAGLLRDDHLVSIAIGLHGTRGQRAAGMELFERWQEFDPEAALAVFMKSDAAYWAGDDLAGVLSRSLGQSPTSTLTTTMSPIKLRILHISDIHFRWAPDPNSDRAEDIRRETPMRTRVIDDKAWRDNIADLLDDGPINLICLTGDIADRGNPEEYEQATRFVEKLLAALNLTKSHLLVIPGNHDIDRSKQADAWSGIRKQPWTIRSELSNWLAGGQAPAGVEGAWRNLVSERQSAFWAWVEHDLGRADLLPAKSPHKHFGYRINVAQTLGLSVPFWILGLDTAWLAGDEHDAGKLLLTKNQLMQLGTDHGHALSGFRLALGHHPLADLADREESGRLLAEYADLYLHGHQHQPITRLSIDPDRHLLELAAGCLFEGTRKDEHPNGFQVIELHLDEHGRPLQVGLRFRTWSTRGHWHDDGSIYRQAKNGRLTLTWPPLAAST